MYGCREYCYLFHILLKHLILKHTYNDFTGRHVLISSLYFTQSIKVCNADSLHLHHKQSITLIINTAYKHLPILKISLNIINSKQTIKKTIKILKILENIYSYIHYLVLALINYI